MGTRYIEMDPGIADAEDSGLADELATHRLADPVGRLERLGRAERQRGAAAPTSPTRWCGTSSARWCRRGCSSCCSAVRTERRTARGGDAKARGGRSHRIGLVRSALVLPTYQESENIGPLLRAIRGVCPDLDVIVADDNSPDGTGKLAEEAARSSAASRCCTGRASGPRRRVPPRLPPRSRPGLRHRHPDGRRLLPRSRRCCRAPDRRGRGGCGRGHRVPLRARRRGAELDVDPPDALAVRQRVRRVRRCVCGMRDATSGVPGVHRQGSSRRSTSTAPPPTATSSRSRRATGSRWLGRHGRRAPDQLHRP